VSPVALTSTHDGDVVIVEIRGAIDPSNSDELGKELLGVMPGYRGVVLDLAEMPYSDGGVVALLLLTVQQELAGAGYPALGRHPGFVADPAGAAGRGVAARAAAA
jgi:hypothetical protein